MQRTFRSVVTTLTLISMVISVLSACVRPQPSVVDRKGPASAYDQSPGQLAIYLFDPDTVRLVRRTGIEAANAGELLELLKNPGEDHKLVSPLPEGTTLRVAAHDRQTMTIEIGFMGTPLWGTRREAILFDSVVLTLGELPGVDAVRFIVKGSSYLGRVDLSQPFSRDTLLAPQESYDW